MYPGLEAISRTNGAWYDVDCKKSKVRQDGELVIRFREFPTSDQELYNLHDLDTVFRLCSRPVEDSQCHELSQGSFVCALAKFPETGGERWMDAEVVDARPVDHASEEECSCQFKVKWVGIQRLLPSEVGELKIQDPCWVGIDRICTHEAATHLEHPAVMKWKRAMVYSSKTNSPNPPSSFQNEDPKTDQNPLHEPCSLAPDLSIESEAPCSSPNKHEDTINVIETVRDHPNHPPASVRHFSEESPGSSSQHSPEKPFPQPVSLCPNGYGEYQATGCSRKRTAEPLETGISEESELRVQKKRMTELPPWRDTALVDPCETEYALIPLEKMSVPDDMVAWRVGKLFGSGSEPHPITVAEICEPAPPATPYVYKDDTSEKISFLTELWKEGYLGASMVNSTPDEAECPQEISLIEKSEDICAMPLFQHIPTRPRSNTVRRSRFRAGCSMSDRGYPTDLAPQVNHT